MRDASDPSSLRRRSAAIGLAAAVAACAGAAPRAPAPEPDVPAALSTRAMAAYTKPRTKEPRCVERSVRMTPEMLGGHTGPVTVKFAVTRDGSIARFECMSLSVPDPAAAEIERAVRSCEWIPGTDREGRPTGIWIILPMRFGAAR